MEPAIQVSPVTESEMEQVRSIFGRMADTILGATQLSADVQNLRDAVRSLQNDLDYLRNRNAELDTQVTEVRRQRDDAVNALSLLQRETSDVASTIASLRRDNDALNDAIERQRTQIESLKRERDDAIYAHMELTEKWLKVQPAIEALCGLLPKPAYGGGGGGYDPLNPTV